MARAQPTGDGVCPRRFVWLEGNKSECRLIPYEDSCLVTKVVCDLPALFLRIKRDQEEGKTKRNDGCGDINRDQEEGKTKQDDGCKLREIRGGLKLGHLW